MRKNVQLSMVEASRVQSERQTLAEERSVFERSASEAGDASRRMEATRAMDWAALAKERDELSKGAWVGRSVGHINHPFGPLKRCIMNDNLLTALILSL